MWKFVALAYLAFWTIILGLGGLASAVLGAPEPVMRGIAVLGSWSPTLVLLVMRRKLLPGGSVRGFYAKAFAGRIRPGVVLGVPILTFGLFAAAAAAAAFLDGSRPGAGIAFDPGAFLGTAALMLFLGPSGEESAWRGYLRPELEGRYGFFRGNILLGLVWAFWHAPLWVLASEFRGLEGLLFAGANVVVLSSLTVILGILMKKSDNLLVAFWTHYCFNLSLSLGSGGIGLFAALSVVYTAAAAVLAAVYRGRRFRSPIGAGTSTEVPAEKRGR